MKTLYEMIKDLTGIDVEQNKISDYLSRKFLDLQDADLKYANLYRANLKGADLSGAVLKDIKITKKQLEQLTVIEDK
ncbi:pentapeptide repeat-containing protein [Spiroplasma citri]|uniref:pentapeptide repeat-containing protein n=1 Tax=Spiroplasma citri TaxID=2133 RepID=UPI002412E746|nr:pentapeptide repeat-containing protein [Spiroplasma citri]WFG97375.1 pentapeptide repeat-containing protein [Spiroplasma citri]